MKKINKGDRFYVFTSWGLVKGTIIKYSKSKYIPYDMQYKLDIDIDKNNLNKPYNFWYTEDQLYKSYIGAVVKNLFR